MHIENHMGKVTAVLVSATALMAGYLGYDVLRQYQYESARQESLRARDPETLEYNRRLSMNTNRPLEGTILAEKNDGRIRQVLTNTYGSEAVNGTRYSVLVKLADGSTVTNIEISQYKGSSNVSLEGNLPWASRKEAEENCEPSTILDMSGSRFNAIVADGLDCPERIARANRLSLP